MAGDHASIRLSGKGAGDTARSLTPVATDQEHQTDADERGRIMAEEDAESRLSQVNEVGGGTEVVVQIT